MANICLTFYEPSNLCLCKIIQLRITSIEFVAEGPNSNYVRILLSFSYSYYINMIVCDHVQWHYHLIYPLGFNVLLIIIITFGIEECVKEL